MIIEYGSDQNKSLRDEKQGFLRTQELEDVSLAWLQRKREQAKHSLGRSLSKRIIMLPKFATSLA